MFHPRRFQSTIFVLATAASLTPGLFGQAAMTCSANAPVAPTVRAEGLTELASDIIITCTGGTPTTAGANPTFSVSMFLSTAVTSRIVGQTVPALTEALLFVDDPTPDKQVACVTTPCGNTDNVIQGKLTQFNALTFDGIPINPPGPSAPRYLRIKNVRVNASQAQSGTPIQAFVSMSQNVPGQNPIPIPLGVSAQQSIAQARSGLSLDVRNLADSALSAPTFVACTAFNLDLANSNNANYSQQGGRSLLLKFTEGYASAWRKRNISTSQANPGAVGSQDSPGLQYNTESGFYNPNLPPINGLRSAGLADSGTRLRALFTNIPANVKVFVSVNPIQPGSTVASAGGTSVKTAVVNANGPFTLVPVDNPIAENGLRLVPASGEVVWEVLDSDPNNVETVTFAVALAYTGNPQPGSGTASVAGSFAPTSVNPTASPTDAAPRFAPSSVPPLTVFSINQCRTNLLFQFMTNQAGFDTGVAVSNTSRDTLNTAPQSGKCTATFYSTPANTSSQYPPLASPILASGEQWTFTVSSVRPGFQGYVVANCEFQFAHGYAFVSDFGATKLAQGYQALVIPDRNRVADPVTTATSGMGEMLIH